MTIEIKLNDDGTLDKIVGKGIHLEQMSDKRWYLAIGDVALSLMSDETIKAKCDSHADFVEARDKPVLKVAAQE